MSSLQGIDEEEWDMSHSASSETANKVNKGSKPAAGPQIAQGETKAVNRMRLLLIGTMTVLMGLGAWGIYQFIRDSEESEFEQAFKAQGNKLVSGFQGDALRKMQSLESLSSTLTKSAQDMNATWPTVTFPDSARMFEPYLALSNAVSLVASPVVQGHHRLAWKRHVQENQGWVDRDIQLRKELLAEIERNNQPLNDSNKRRHRQLQEDDGKDGESVFRRTPPSSEYFVDEEELEKTVTPYIKTYVGPDTSNGPWLVWWQYAPVIPNKWFVNFNRLSFDGFSEEVQSTLDGRASISRTWNYKPGLDFQSTRDFTFTQQLLEAGSFSSPEPEPIIYIHYPIKKDFSSQSETAAVLTATIYWKTYFEGILSEEGSGIFCVVKNSLGQAFTYQINGKEAVFLGMEDMHEPRFDDKVISAPYSSFEDVTGDKARYTGVPVDDQQISYTISVYPSSDMEAEFLTEWPVAISLALVGVFLLTCGVFILYDWVVGKRQEVVMNTATRSGAILSSLFPEKVKDQLLADEAEKEAKETGNRKKRLKSFLTESKKAADGWDFIDVDDGDERVTPFKTKPIADLFPETTIMFADLCGFTSWSSTREPTQVFQLLETIYSAFDDLAKKRKVFKVETVGDCYVAVTGIPDPRKDHATAMCRFAKDCYVKMKTLTRRLEIELGPETSNLTMRFGIHSGPVTGGVLRGDRSRFQLFGDTMNTASRMESTGLPDRIQISQDTANLLIDAGKAYWFVRRAGNVVAKGKGELTTYWLKIGQAGSTPGSGIDSSNGSYMSDDLEDAPIEGLLSKKTTRLVDYNAEILRKHIKKIVAQREVNARSNSSQCQEPVGSGIPMDELREIIDLPLYDAGLKFRQRDPTSVKLSKEVETQLHSFVLSIASLYRSNPFHNFHHAHHVASSVSKLFSTIVEMAHEDESSSQVVSAHARLLSSDALVQFACVFSALIHDVDHSGVSNKQLLVENQDMAVVYNGKSPAEQNSIDVAWSLFMADDFNDLRSAICSTPNELGLLRQLVVNSVLATDIFEPDLKRMRNERWERAFDNLSSEEPTTAMKRKATIVIEHLIQASDIAHTMQHWKVYSAWNERLFMEMYKAYEDGRAEKNPAEFWYKGELWFFENYVIPLAKKLKQCGVFGVRSDEYLNYAIKNKEEFEAKGQAIVEKLVELTQNTSSEV